MGLWIGDEYVGIYTNLMDFAPAFRDGLLLCFKLMDMFVFKRR